MKKNITKIALLLIAAVMMVAMCFAGAASAKTVEVTDWNNQVIYAEDPELTDFGIIGTGLEDGDIIKITGGSDYVIEPLKYGSSGVFSRFKQSLTLDFSEYKGTFAGSTSSTGYIGSLFGKVAIAPGKTLEIKGLNLTSVNVNGNGNIGGIIGVAEDDDVMTSSGTLFFNDCHLLNCSIGGSTTVGGLLGYASGIVPIVVKNCTVSHCDVVASSNYVGGMVGYLLNSSTWEGCRVTNSTVASTEGDFVGGLLGKDGTTATFTDCAVVDTSVYAGSAMSRFVGGLAGGVSAQGISGCKLTNCVIASQGFCVGGLSGNPSTADGVDGCEVKNCTLSTTSMIEMFIHIGGLFGGSSVTPTGQQTNDVLNSAIYGSNVFGTNCAGIGRSSVGSVTAGASITYHKSDGTELSPSTSTFWKEVSWGGCGDVRYTVLGTYGTVGGYGVGSAPKLVYDAGGATGTVPSSRLYASGTTVTVPGQGDLQKAGCTFMGWYSERTGLLPAGSSFEITEDTTLSALWSMPPYVTVSSWADLNKSVAEWNATGIEKDLTRTVVVKNDILDRNSGENVDGINVSGNVIITPDASSTDKKLSIDGKEFGRLFNITSTGNLTLIGNGTSTLELTKGKHKLSGGAVYVEGTGMLTLSAGADITNSTSVDNTGGGVAIHSGTLTMNGGNITGCTAKNAGGGVDVHIDAVFTMTAGSITKCKSNDGGGVSTRNQVQLRVSGDATIVDNTLPDGTTRNNVYLVRSDNLQLAGPLTGMIGISNLVTPGNPFGKAAGMYQEAVNIFMDADTTQRGLAVTGSPDYDLIWESAMPITLDYLGNGHAKTNVSAGRTDDYVTITAYPDEGYIIAGYTFQNINPEFTDPFISPDNTTTFKITGASGPDIPITAEFAETGTYVLQKVLDTEGTICWITDRNGDGTINHLDGFGEISIPLGSTQIPAKIMRNLSSNYPKEVFILQANYYDESTGSWVFGDDLNDNTGKLLPNVKITLDDGSEIDFTDSDGKWVFNSLNSFAPSGSRYYFKYICDVGKLVPGPSTPTPYTPSHRETGYTVILPENTTVTPTPTAKPTVQPIENPTMKPTTQPTQKSPAPFAGLAAGLGAVLVIARLRK